MRVAALAACAAALAARSALAAACTIVEYIQGTGDASTPCYLLTDFTPNPQTDKIVAEFSLTDLTRSAVIWCARSTPYVGTWTLLWVADYAQLRFDYNTTVGPMFGGGLALATRYTATVENNVMTWSGGSGLTQGFDASFTATGGPLALFAVCNGSDGSCAAYSNHRLYSFRIYRNGVLLHDLAPAMDAAGNGTLVDLCADPLKITRAGTFLVGNPANNLRAKVLGPCAWTGSPVLPDLLVTDPFGHAVDSSLYDVTATNNVDPGVAYATVTGKGLYAGTVTVSFCIAAGSRAALYGFARECEYAQGDGTAYVDLGMKLTDADEARLTVLECENQSAPVFGSRSGTGSSDKDCFIFGYNDLAADSDVAILDCGCIEGRRLSLTPKASGLTPYRLLAVINTTTRAAYYADSETLVDSILTDPADSFTTPAGVWLFGASGTVWSDAKFKGRVYACRVLRDGSARMDLVAARRLADGVVGMYDFVSGTFFTNAAGGGAFTAGPPVAAFAAADIPDQTETGEPICPKDVVVTNIFTGAALVRGRDYAFAADETVTLGRSTPRICGLGDYAGMTNTAPFVIRPVVRYLALPHAYRQVAYLQGDGKGTRILTDYVPAPQTDRIEVTASITSLSRNAALSCSRDLPDSKSYTLWYLAGTSHTYSLRFDYDTENDGVFASGCVSTDVVFRVIAEGPTASWTWGSESYAHATRTSFTAAGGPVMMFASYYGGTDSNPGNFSDHRLYAYRVWRDGALIRDLVPCVRRADGAAGLFCRATGAFFGNAGSGTFRTGPVVTSGLALLVK